MQTAAPAKCALTLSSLALLTCALCGCGFDNGNKQSSGGSGSGGATAGLSSINHIIFLSQENRSFDHYFGALRQYWAQNGYPDQSFDGLPQFNPTSGTAPLAGPAPSIPGCDPASLRRPIALSIPTIP